MQRLKDANLINIIHRLFDKNEDQEPEHEHGHESQQKYEQKAERPLDEYKMHNDETQEISLKRRKTRK